jgi:phage terminase small subunit
MALNAKQKRFCEEYLTDFNATQAAKRAGYSQKTAYSIGEENLRKPEIKAFIDERLKELGLSANETTKLISDIAKASLNKYFTINTVEHTPRIKVHLSKVIQQIEADIKLEQEYADIVNLDEDELKRHNREQENRRKEIVRLKIMLKHNPKATRIVNGETVFVEVAQLDMVALVKDKQAGRIKSVAPTEHGLKVEMYPADAALTNLARIHGLFEKDNEQSKPEIVWNEVKNYGTKR